jgi:hypothetical protein
VKKVLTDTKMESRRDGRHVRISTPFLSSSWIAPGSSTDTQQWAMGLQHIALVGHNWKPAGLRLGGSSC